MDIKHLDDAHYWLSQAFDDLERARYHLAKSNVNSFVWFEDKIKRMHNIIRNLLEGIVNRAIPPYL